MVSTRWLRLENTKADRFLNYKRNIISNLKQMTKKKIVGLVIIILVGLVGSGLLEPYYG